MQNSQLEKQQEMFGGRAPPGLAGKLKRSTRPAAKQGKGKGREGEGKEGVEGEEGKG